MISPAIKREPNGDKNLLRDADIQCFFGRCRHESPKLHVKYFGDNVAVNANPPSASEKVVK